MIKIIDDFLDKETADNLEKIFTDCEFPWFFSEYSVKPEDKSPCHNSLDVLPGHYNTPMFVHSLFYFDGGKSFMCDQVLGIIKNKFPINGNGISRLKVNFTYPLTTYEKNALSIAHVDNCFVPSTAIYYVNDSDGDTVIYNEKYEENTVYTKLTEYTRVTPKKGRLLIFDADTIHAPSLPHLYDKRIVMNINFNQDYKEDV